MTSNKIRELTSENFDTEVLRAQTPCLVDFWAEWCGPCKSLHDVVSSIADANGQKLLVGRVNVDEQGSLAERFGIDTIPTLVLFMSGEIRDTLSGSRSRERILEKIAAFFSGD